MARQLIRNVFSNWAGLALNMATAFFMSPFLVKNLGDTWYGLWVLIRSTTGYMSLVDGGLRVSIVKYVARMDAVDDTTELNRTVSTALAMYSMLTIVVMIGSVGMAAAFPYLFKVTPEVLPTARIVVMIAGLSLALSLASAVFGGLIAGLQRYDIANQVGIGTLVIRTVLIVFLIWKGYGIIALGLVHLGMQVITGVMNVVIAFKLRPGLRIGRSYVNLKSIKTLYGYSVVILMNAMSDLLLFRTGDMLAGMFIGPVAVTYYAIAGTLTEYLQRIVLTMTMVLHPYSSAKEATGDAQGLRDAVVVGTKMCLLIGLPATILMLMIGHAFIAAWMGGNYAAVAAPILTVMAVARLAWVSQSGIGQILLGIGKHKQVTALNIVAGVTSFIGGYFMARHGGLYWMTVGSAVPLVVVHGFITPLFTSRVVGVPLGHYIGEGYLKPLLGVIPFAIALFALIETFPPHTLWAVAAVVLAAVPVYVLGVYFLSFSADERRTYLSMLAPSWLAAKS